MADFSIVEKRFQDILKHRLSEQIELHPPLFPWETEVIEYPTDFGDEFSGSKVSSWLSQICLPVQLPARMLSQLVCACCEIIDSFDPQPIQMVKVVSQLFPDQFNFLNQQAGLLAVAGVSRGVATFTKEFESIEALDSYENCSIEQQMTLSLLATQQILNALILNLSDEKPFIEKEWETPRGNIFVKAYYLKFNQQIRVEIDLPEQGQISWFDQDKLITIDWDSTENYSFYFTQIQAQKVHSVKINLFDPQENILTFGLKLDV